MLTTTCAALAVALLLTTPAAASEATMTLAAKGKARCRIVVPDKPGPAVSYAASELHKYLLEISGADVPVVEESQAGRGAAILLGPSNRAERAGLVEAARRLGEDGVLIKTAGKDLVLLGGGERGQIYSVYVLLERYLGCRFLARDCTVAPKREAVTLPTINFSYAPPFIYRELLCNELADWGYAARLRLNGSNMPHVGVPWRGGEVAKGILIYPFVHSACALIPPDKYAKTHPEYFGLVKGQRRAAVISGQLCWTNPDVLRLCTEQVLKWLDEQPNLMCVDVSQNDAWPGDSGACECDKCTAIVKEEEAQHGPILRFVNAIAAEVAKKKPSVFVDTLAYDYSITPPKHTKPLPNVVIRLCHFACYFHGIECDPLGANYRKAIDGWHAVAKNVFVWHYGTNFWHYLAPNPNLRSMVSDIKYYASHGINGLMVQSDIQSVGGELSDLRHYVNSQLMWDPSQDAMALRTEFCRGYYGAAADDALEFLALMDRLAAGAPHKPMNGWNPPDVATPAFVKEGLAVLNRGLARTTDPVIRNRVEKMLLPLWFVQLGWPDVYGVSPAEARATTANFKRVAKANGITTISEGPPNAEAWIAALEAKYGTPDAPK